MPIELKVEEVRAAGSNDAPGFLLSGSMLNADSEPICPISLQVNSLFRSSSDVTDLGDTNIALNTIHSQLFPPNLQVHSLNPREQWHWRARFPLNRRALSHAEMHGGRHDLAIEGKIWGVVLALQSQTRSWVPHSLPLTNWSKTIPRSEWDRWLVEWGRDVEALHLTGPVARNFTNFRDAVKLQDPNDLMVVLLSAYEQSKSGNHSPPRLVRTSPKEFSIKAAIREIAAEATRGTGRLWVMAPHLDASMRQDIVAAATAGAEVRLLIRDPEGQHAKKQVTDALKHFSPPVSVRINPYVHARMYLSKESVLIGSADLNTVSLDSNRELGVHLRDSRIRMEAEKFFEDVWNESTPWAAKP